MFHIVAIAHGTLVVGEQSQRVHNLDIHTALQQVIKCHVGVLDHIVQKAGNHLLAVAACQSHGQRVQNHGQAVQVGVALMGVDGNAQSIFDADVLFVRLTGRVG